MDFRCTSCRHVKRFKKNKGKIVYKFIHGLLSGLIEGSPKENKIKKETRKARDFYCYTCNTKSCRKQVCTTCVFIGCMDRHHMKEHARKKKHFISVDLEFGKVYCNKCNDYMYDEELEDISNVCKRMVAKKLGLPYNPRYHPKKADLKRIREYTPVELHRNSLIGIKSIENFGNTCYMNTILLALVHVPLLRDHYLSEEHKCRLVCKKAVHSNEKDANSLSEGGADKKYSKRSEKDQQNPKFIKTNFKEYDMNSCIGCELSNIFEEFYCGNPSPGGFVPFIYKFKAKDFKYNDPNNSYEFLEEIIRQLHEGDCDPSKCTCIIGKVFKSVRRQDSLTVSSLCNARLKRTDIYSSPIVISPSEIEMTLTPCAPFSMDVDSISCKIEDCSNDGTQSFTDIEESAFNQPFTLQNYIKRYMEFPPIKKKCATCENDHCKETTYQRLFFLKLPEVFYFLINVSMEHRVVFPKTLDMWKFIPNEIKNSDPFKLCDYKYNLYAVVEHRDERYKRKTRSPKIKGLGGHYVIYLRQNFDRWFLISDATVEQVTFEEVAEKEAEILFYYKDVYDQEGTTWMSKINPAQIIDT